MKTNENETALAYFCNGGSTFISVPMRTDDASDLGFDWESAAVGSSFDYWEPISADQAEEWSECRIESNRLPENLR